MTASDRAGGRGTMSADISPNVVILTREELSERERKAFQRGIERGRFEHGLERTQQRVAARCTHWTNGRCETCGVPWQHFEVDAAFKCPHFSEKPIGWAP